MRNSDPRPCTRSAGLFLALYAGAVLLFTGAVTLA